MRPVNLSHHLFHALDEINSSHSKTKEIEKKLIEDIDEIRRDVKTVILEAYNNEQISALHVKGLFRFIKLEND